MPTVQHMFFVVRNTFGFKSEGHNKAFQIPDAWSVHAIGKSKPMFSALGDAISLEKVLTPNSRKIPPIVMTCNHRETMFSEM
jgi:hypothetical protein